MTVLLRPLSLTHPPRQTLILVLSSKKPVRWWLEAERLPPDLPVLVQVSLCVRARVVCVCTSFSHSSVIHPQKNTVLMRVFASSHEERIKVLTPPVCLCVCLCICVVLET